MSQFMQAEHSSTLGSEQRSSSEFEGMSVSASRKMEELENMVNSKFSCIIGLLEQSFEDMNQRIMKLELAVEKLLASTRSNLESKIQNNKQRCLKLQFNSNISSPILTGEQIKGEEGNNMQVSLVDTYTGEVINIGPEASAKVEIVALEGDLEYDEADTWTAEDFNSKIAGEREEKKSILAGILLLKLNNGIVSLSDIKFRSSSRHNSGVFKLGARVVDTYHGIRVIEAKTKSFRVQDYRRKYNQKHHPPSASDEVWRLENIGKGGRIHERLKKEKVNYVKDFQAILSKDPEWLKSLLGLPAKKWEATVSHVQTCKPDNMSFRQENIGELNVVGQADASNMSGASAHEHWGVVSLDDEASLLQHISHSSTVVEHSSSLRLENTGGQDIEASEMGEFDPTNLNTSFEDTFSSMNPIGFDTVKCCCNLNSINDTEITNSSDTCSQGLGSDSRNDSPLRIPDINLYELNNLLNDVLGEESCSSYRKKSWTLLFTVSKWFSRRKRLAGVNHVQKKQRLCH